jgi:hypothetical protein
VRRLLGDRVTDVMMRRQSVRIDRFTTPTAFRDFFKATYGPTIAVYKNISDDVSAVEALDRELDELARRHTDPAGAMEWEYLLLTARRA